MKKNSFASVTAYLIIFLLIVLVVGFFARFTNGFSENFKTFYVEKDGKLLSAEGSLALKPDEICEFNVGYTFSFLPNTPTESSVRVFSTVTDETAFNYTVDGEKKTYNSDIDLTEVFNVSPTETGFSLVMPSSMQEVLSSVYSDKIVEILDDISLSSTNYFCLQVSNYDLTNVIKIALHIDDKPTNIILTPDKIVF